MPRFSSLWLVLLGGVAALGQAPVSLPWLTLLAMGGLFYAQSHSGGPRASAWRGWLFGVGYFAVALNWIVEPFFVDPWRHGWMAPFALVFLSGGLALFWAAALALAKRLTPGAALGAIAFALALTAAELARSYVLTGFPWALIGHVWIGWPLVHVAAWTGPHGLTLLTVLVPALVVASWRGRRVLAWITVAAFIAVFAAGLPRETPFVQTADSPTLRLIQPNAPQHLKWHPDHVRGFYERGLELTSAAAETKPDLIIWPETSVPTLLERAGPALARIAEAAGGVPVVLGIQRGEEGRYYNSLVVLGPDGALSDIYDKHHLVPFGEYIPAGNLLARIGITAFASQAGNGYSAGPGPRVLDLGDLGRPMPLICYEAIFPQYSRAEPRPDWLLQITNDAWFGEWVGPYQHLAQARLRAVEQGLPMVRVANTGVSAVIGPLGQVTAALPLNEAGYLDVLLPHATAPTLYSRTGDAPMALLLILGLLTLGYACGRKPIDLSGHQD
ncbi:Apolipoprotein N-acyltransferase [Candidatus Rhodobacter oscarellae]|uniref:Apolipoprotein N-acyltransferase n=1 Tax=Candidatus Rhodobacter oscarellae TaxID=1675527 RepID=A0A0J9GSH6_9RHOB|nr:apolipoprotein N-acyltransferase [Candidatus Rhodobacter lobularis]KMW56453.1 Apolipoprotein N-acyltransferase [Candidatus Rhodobacter lobularis]